MNIKDSIDTSRLRLATPLIAAIIATFTACAENDDDEDELGDGRCSISADCNGGEVCDAGFCVAAGGSATDPVGGTNPGSDDGPGEDDGPAPGEDDGPAPGEDDGPAPGEDDGPAPGEDDGPAPGDDDGPSTCVEGEFTCEGSTIEACVEGSLEQYTCDEVCGASGYTSDGCNADGQCGCDGFADVDCANGVNAFCVCLEAAGETCSDDDFTGFYQGCWQGESPEFACFADYITGNEIDCAAAVEACL